MDTQASFKDMNPNPPADSKTSPAEVKDSGESAY